MICYNDTMWVYNNDGYWNIRGMRIFVCGIHPVNRPTVRFNGMVYTSHCEIRDGFGLGH